MAKHGVTFEEAAEVFLDPFYVMGDASANNEDRDFILGYSLAERLLLVVHVERGSKNRIISARVVQRCADLLSTIAAVTKPVIHIL